MNYLIDFLLISLLAAGFYCGRTDGKFHKYFRISESSTLIIMMLAMIRLIQVSCLFVVGS